MNDQALVAGLEWLHREFLDDGPAAGLQCTVDGQWDEWRTGVWTRAVR